MAVCRVTLSNLPNAPPYSLTKALRCLQGIPIHILKALSNFFMEKDVQTVHFILDCDFACRPCVGNPKDPHLTPRSSHNFTWARPSVLSDRKCYPSAGPHDPVQPQWLEHQSNAVSQAAGSSCGSGGAGCTENCDVSLMREWGTLRPHMWVMAACHSDERVHTCTANGCVLGRFTYCCYSTLLGTSASHPAPIPSEERRPSTDDVATGGGARGAFGAKEPSPTKAQPHMDEPLLPSGKVVLEQLALAQEHDGMLALKLPHRDDKKRAVDEDLRLRMQNTTAFKKSLASLFDDIRVAMRYNSFAGVCPASPRTDPPANTPVRSNWPRVLGKC